MNKISRVFQLAIEEACTSCMESRHGAILIGAGGVVLAKGHNSCRTRMFGKNCHCIHAEVDAISRFKKTKGFFHDTFRQMDRLSMVRPNFLFLY
jgi:tRNA(Arg) A34 adenosine deaminase TadA